MEDKVYDPAELAYKLKQGTISAEEQQWFERWYAGFNDEEVLLSSAKYTSTDQIRENIFGRISAQMDAQPLSARKVIPMWRKMAAVAAILLLVGFTVLYSSAIYNLISPVHQIQLSSNVNQHRQIKLPDGTRVWLSPATKISYPDRFSEEQRIVKLEGEAFFEVMHDAKHPFIVQSGKLKTVVLGTSFNVSAYPKAASTEVTVVSGKVGVILKNGVQTQQQIAVANQRTTYNTSTNALIKEDYPDAAKYLDQRNGLFVFKGVALKTVCSEIELQYGVHIIISANLSNKDPRFYGRFNTTEPVQKTLNKLSMVMETKWSNTGDVYYLQEIAAH